MKILAISSLYPPDYLGGYELACADVMIGLRDRGHEVHILTSRRRQGAGPLPPDDEWTHRVLDFAPLSQTQGEGIVTRAWREWRDNMQCRRWVQSVRPDIITIWDMWGLLPGLLASLERTGIAVTYAVSSPWVLEYAAISHRWPAFWDPGQSRGIKKLLKQTAGRLLRRRVDPFMPTKPPQADLRRAFFASRALRQTYIEAGWQCENNPVIYHGVDTGLFAPPSERLQPERGKLLVSGRIVPEKGFHLAVEALALLAKDGFKHQLALDIVGPQPDPGYVSSLTQMIHQHDLEDVIHFRNQVPREAMPGVYHNHDISIVPSVWDEPFSLTILEAMACGLVVVGTDTGGSKEILEHEITGLVFKAGDAASLTAQLKRIFTEPQLGGSLTQQARQRIQQSFDIARAVDQIEEFLYDSM